MVKDMDADEFKDWDVTLSDGLDDIDVEFDYIDVEPGLSENDVKVIVDANDNPKEPNKALKDAAQEFGAFGEELQKEPPVSKPGFVPFEMRGINTRVKGLSEQAIENRTVKTKQPKTDTDGGGKGPLYNLRMSKQRKANTD